MNTITDNELELLVNYITSLKAKYPVIDYNAAGDANDQPVSKVDTAILPVFKKLVTINKQVRFSETLADPQVNPLSSTFIIYMRGRILMNYDAIMGFVERTKAERVQQQQEMIELYDNTLLADLTPRQFQEVLLDTLRKAKLEKLL